MLQTPSADGGPRHRRSRHEPRPAHPLGRVRRARWAVTLSALLAGSSVAVGVVATGTAQAEPDVASVQKQVDTLFREAEQASERANDAKLAAAHLRRDLRGLQADRDRQSESLSGVRQQVQESIVSQYQGQSLSVLGEMVSSDDPTDFVQGVSSVSAYNEVQGDLLDTYATELKALKIRTGATAEREQELERTRAELAAEKQTVDTKLAEAKERLAQLQADQREAVLQRGSVAVPASVPASGRAGAAISYAMAQVHDAYVYGAAGPDAFDCSGLMMRAWGQAGVSLPHSSSAQYSSGPHVSAGDLRPGDLVFYYSPISHVAMYIGNGLIVEAANPGAGVRVSGLYSMPYVGAVRPG